MMTDSFPPTLDSPQVEVIPRACGCFLCGYCHEYRDGEFFEVPIGCDGMLVGPSCFLAAMAEYVADRRADEWVDGEYDRGRGAVGCSR